MAEVGVDLRSPSPKTVDRFLALRWDYVITVYDAASEACSVFAGRTARLHGSFVDPPAATGTDVEAATP